MTVLRTVFLLAIANLFMTYAWYGHLKHTNFPLWKAILFSWGIAFFEYCIQVPANRWAYGSLTAYQLKILQEAITLVVFVGFAWWYLGEAMQIKHLVSFALILAAVVVAFRP